MAKFSPDVAEDLAELLVELSNNKETRPIVGKAIKKLKPDSRHAKAFADLDVDDKFESFKAEQERKELDKQRQELLDRQERQRQKLLAGDGGRKYSEDDVEKIKSLMNQKGIIDYEDGAVLYASTLPPDNPNPSNPPHVNNTTWEFPQFEEYSKNPALAARNSANTVITEFMRAKR